MNAIKRLISTFYHWATQIPYNEGWEDGIKIGYDLAKREAEHTVTLRERKRFITILKRERERMVHMEKLHWDGYNSDIVSEIDILIVLVDNESGKNAK
jgi:hypothetical protein